MPLKHLTRLGFTALLLAWCFDQLFWQKTPGISFLLFVLLCLAGGAFLALGEDRKPAPASLLLLIPLFFFAGMTFVRLEEFTLLVDYGLALACLALLAITWLGGRWWQYGLRDYLVNGLRLMGGMLARPISAFSNRPAGEGAAARASAWGRYRPLLSVLAGLLLAFPVVAVLALLLSEADPIFEKSLTGLLELLRIENLGEYIFRITYISIGAYLLAGVFLFVLLSSGEENLSDKDHPAIPPFLGWLESATVLACVDLLFGFFVAVQLRYFFGGQANIHVDGFTYAEYARRGFGELVAAAFISLLLFLSLSAVTRREQPAPRRVFSGLGLVLLGLVAVMLVSAFQRLQLYEIAYGFSRIRTYTHIFMAWLGILLALTVLLEVSGRMRHFALALALVAVGFGATLNLVNVDAFIVRANLQRATLGLALDVNYLAAMSDDAAPALFAGYDRADLPAAARQQVGALLACSAAQRQAEERPLPWPSFHGSTFRADRVYAERLPGLEAFNARLVAGEWQVLVDGKKQPCPAPDGFMD